MFDTDAKIYYGKDNINRATPVEGLERKYHTFEYDLTKLTQVNVPAFPEEGVAFELPANIIVLSASVIVLEPAGFIGFPFPRVQISGADREGNIIYGAAFVYSLSALSLSQVGRHFKTSGSASNYMLREPSIPVAHGVPGFTAGRILVTLETVCYPRIEF